MDTNRTRELAGLPLEEAVDMAKEIDKIAQMTDVNDHTGAAIAGAKLLKHKKLEKIFKAIDTIQELEGHMPKELGDVRYMYQKQLWDYAKKKLSKEDANKFHGAF